MTSPEFELPACLPTSSRRQGRSPSLGTCRLIADEECSAGGTLAEVELREPSDTGAFLRGNTLLPVSPPLLLSCRSPFPY